MSQGIEDSFHRHPRNCQKLRSQHNIWRIARKRTEITQHKERGGIIHLFILYQTDDLTREEIIYLIAEKSLFWNVSTIQISPSITFIYKTKCLIKFNLQN